MKWIQTLSTQSIQLQNTYTLPSIPHYLLQTAAPLPPFFPFHPQGRNMEAQTGCNLQHTDMCELNLTRSTNSAQRWYTYWHNLLIVQDAPFGGSLSHTNTPSKENILCPNTTQQRGGQPTTRTGDSSLFSKNTQSDVCINHTVFIHAYLGCKNLTPLNTTKKISDRVNSLLTDKD